MQKINKQIKHIKSTNTYKTTIASMTNERVDNIECMNVIYNWNSVPYDIRCLKSLFKCKLSTHLLTCVTYPPFSHICIVLYLFNCCFLLVTPISPRDFVVNKTYKNK